MLIFSFISVLIALFSASIVKDIYRSYHQRPIY